MQVEEREVKDGCSGAEAPFFLLGVPTAILLRIRLPGPANAPSFSSNDEFCGVTTQSPLNV